MSLQFWKNPLIIKETKEKVGKKFQKEQYLHILKKIISILKNLEQ